MISYLNIENKILMDPSIDKDLVLVIYGYAQQNEYRDN